MRRLLFWLLLLIALCCTSVLTDVRAPAEFEEQEAILLCWNRAHTDLLSRLITLISEEDRVELFYNENYHTPADIRNHLFLSGARFEHVKFIPFRLEHENIWIRDYGPGFVLDTRGELHLRDFNYPHQEYPDYINFTDQVSGKMQIPFLKTGVKGTGGGRLVNGQGTMILTEGYEKEINPGLTKAQIEEEYREHFNVHHFIWLKKGIPQDDFAQYGPIIENIYGTGANWHLDEFCRFAGPRTILLTDVTMEDIERDTFYSLIKDRLDENYAILSKAVDQHGQPFDIIRLPSAPVIYAAGRAGDRPVVLTPVTSYLNFVITNNSIIYPTYFQTGDPDFVLDKDHEARTILQSAFPTRKIKSMNAMELNKKGGGLRCITLEKPATKTTPRVG